MTEEHPGPIVLRRRLGTELRRLRDTTKLTVEEVGKEMEWSRSKVSRMETGQALVKSYEIGVLCEKHRRGTEAPLPMDVRLGEHVPDRDVIPHDLGGYDAKR